MTRPPRYPRAGVALAGKIKVVDVPIAMTEVSDDGEVWGWLA